MTHVLRWHRTSYEQLAHLHLERDASRSLGLQWSHWPERQAPKSVVREADILVVTSKVKVTREVLESFRGQLVLTTTSGYDHIDVEAASSLGIAVGRCPTARRDAVVEQALGQLLTLMRRQTELYGSARAGKWKRAELPRMAGRLLLGSRVGVVGHGVIGRRMCEVLAAVGANPVVIDPGVQQETFEQGSLLSRAPRLDAVTLHCSLTPSSHGLLSREVMEALPDHAVIVNTARGDVLDVQAAVDMVRRGRLRGLAVDVFPEEPYPQLASAASHPGILFTPHAAGYSHDLGQRVALAVAANLRAWVHDRNLPEGAGVWAPRVAVPQP